jgi:hypothetical protein
LRGAPLPCAARRRGHELLTDPLSWDERHAAAASTSPATLLGRSVMRPISTRMDPPLAVPVP